MASTYQQFPLALSLDQDASFDNFCVLANPTAVSYLNDLVTRAEENWCFLSGAPATGKSHLLQAVVNEVESLGQQAIYLDCQELLQVTRTNEQVSEGGGPVDSITEDEAENLLASMEQYDVIALDNLDVFTRHATWLRAVFYLLVKLKQRSQSKIVFAASKAVDQLEFDLADLVSRLNSATAFRLRSYSDEEKKAILMHRAQCKGLEMNAEVANYIMQRYSRDLNQLIDALNRLDTQAMVRQRGLTIPFVRQELLL